MVFAAFPARLALALAVVLFAFGALPEDLDRPVIGRLANMLEQRFPRTDVAEGDAIAGIIVLGGGVMRTLEAIELAQRYPDAQLVITGANDDDYAAAIAALPGADRLISERLATSTYENALLTQKIVAPAAPGRWLLVTSAIHMPRALGSFARAGFKVEPWPVYDMQFAHPQAPAAVRHELLGLVAYRMLGRTGELFPGPARAGRPTPAIRSSAAEPPRDEAGNG